MKKAKLVALISCSFILAGCSKGGELSYEEAYSNSNYSSPENSSNFSSTTISSNSSGATILGSTPHIENTDEPDNPETPVSQGFYDSVFKGIEPSNPFTSGSPISYDEAMTIITKPEYNGIDSFFLVEAVEAMTLPECENLKGFEDWFRTLNGFDYDEVKGNDYFGDHVIYKVKVLKDLISGEQRSGEIFLDCVSSNPIFQNEGNPPYSPGEKFTVVTHNKTENSDITRSCANYIFTLDIYEAGDELTAYAREGSSIADVCNVEGMKKISESVITSTTENPAKFTAEFELSNFVDFLRRDWKERKVSHYEKTE